jgi:hypothetical protein
MPEPRLFTQAPPKESPTQLLIPIPTGNEPRGGTCTNNPDPAVYACVTYKLEGKARIAEITIANESGGTEHHTVNVPWMLQFLMPRGEYASLIADNPENSGGLTATIYVDGQVLQQANTTAPHGSVVTGGGVRSPKVNSSITFGEPVPEKKKP